MLVDRERRAALAIFVTPPALHCSALGHTARVTIPRAQAAGRQAIHKPLRGGGLEGSAHPRQVQTDPRSEAEALMRAGQSAAEACRGGLEGVRHTGSDLRPYLLRLRPSCASSSVSMRALLPLASSAGPWNLHGQARTNSQVTFGVLPSSSNTTIEPVCRMGFSVS